MTRSIRFTLAVFAGAALAACGDAPLPLSPEVAAPVAQPQMTVNDNRRDDDALSDAVERLMPALADEPGIPAISALLRQLQNEQRGTSPDAAARTRAVVMTALDRLEREASEAAGADIGALRLALEATR